MKWNRFISLLAIGIAVIAAIGFLTASGVIVYFRDKQTEREQFARSQFLRSIAASVEKYLSDNGQFPANREALRPIIKATTPEDLELDEKTYQVFARTALLRDIHALGNEHYVWLIVVLVPAEGNIKTDLICFLGNSEVNGHESRDMIVTCVTPDLASQRLGRSVVDAAYQADREGRSRAATQQSQR